MLALPRPCARDAAKEEPKCMQGLITHALLHMHMHMHMHMQGVSDSSCQGKPAAGQTCFCTVAFVEPVTAAVQGKPAAGQPSLPCCIATYEA